MSRSTAPRADAVRPGARGGCAAVVAATAVALLSMTPAAAHTGLPAHGLLDGAVHPVQGLDHLLAMVAVGVVAALTARRLPMWALPAAFVGGMVAGGALGFAGVPLPGGELVIAGSVVAGAALVASAGAGIPAGWLLAGVALVGAVHGRAHGAEAPDAGSALLYVLGFVAATAAIHLAGAGLGVLARRSPGLRTVLAAGLAGTGLALLLGV